MPRNHSTRGTPPVAPGGAGGQDCALPRPVQPGRQGAVGSGEEPARPSTALGHPEFA